MEIIYLADEIECILCCENTKTVYSLPCQHNIFCVSCLDRWFAETKIGENKNCPYCRSEIEPINYDYIEKHCNDMANNYKAMKYHYKIQRLLKERLNKGEQIPMGYEIYLSPFH